VRAEKEKRDARGAVCVRERACARERVIEGKYFSETLYRGKCRRFDTRVNGQIMSACVCAWSGCVFLCLTLCQVTNFVRHTTRQIHFLD